MLLADEHFLVSAGRSATEGTSKTSLITVKRVALILSFIFFVVVYVRKRNDKKVSLFLTIRYTTLKPDKYSGDLWFATY